jgi:hypothetical protein
MNSSLGNDVPLDWSVACGRAIRASSTTTSTWRSQPVFANTPCKLHRSRRGLCRGRRGQGPDEHPQRGCRQRALLELAGHGRPALEGGSKWHRSVEHSRSPIDDLRGVERRASGKRRASCFGSISASSLGRTRRLQEDAWNTSAKGSSAEAIALNKELRVTRHQRIFWTNWSTVTPFPS